MHQLQYGHTVGWEIIHVACEHQGTLYLLSVWGCWQGGTCHSESCIDQQWDGACCLHPLNNCQRFDENYWECRTGSTFVSAE